VALSPNGQRLALAKPGGLVRVLGLATDEGLRELSGEPGTILSMAFSPDAKLAGHDALEPEPGRPNLLALWDVNRGEAVFRQMDGGTCLAFSADGQRLAVGNAGEGR